LTAANISQALLAVALKYLQKNDIGPDSNEKHLKFFEQFAQLDFRISFYFKIDIIKFPTLKKLN